MAAIGIIECFYGRPWTLEIRERYATFLKEIGFQFYIYGPKSDSRLRKFWRQPLTKVDRDWFQEMQRNFSDQGLQFGIILSPHGLLNRFDLSARTDLKEQVAALSDIGLDYLGLFFDDMKSSSELAQRQLEIVDLVQSQTKARLIFCPSYYSYDSLLDMLFGDRPPDYLETLGKGLSPDVEVVWTGEEVISKEISADHLRRVGAVLRRKPFLCDNFYTIDTPINSHFLRILRPSGRSPEVFQAASSWAFNPMNAPHLSQIVLKAMADYLKGMDPKRAFLESVQSHCATSTAEFILAHYQRFAEEGLDPLSEAEKFKMRQQLASAGPIESELIEWLDGRFLVDFEDMIEQSGYEA